MPQITLDFSDDLNKCRTELAAKPKISPFSELNFTLIASFQKKIESAGEELHKATKIPLKQLQQSPAYYVLFDSYFFLEHLKNAHDAGATKLTLTINLDVATNEMVCTLKDNGKGFSSMFAVPPEPVLPEKAVELQKKVQKKEAITADEKTYLETQEKVYVAALEKYERQTIRQSIKDASGFTDYRKVLDPLFDPEVGKLNTKRQIVSDKGASHGQTDEVGGRGMGLASTAALLHHVTGGCGTIQIGDRASLASNAAKQAISGPPLAGEQTGAVTIISSPVFSPTLYAGLVHYMKTDPDERLKRTSYAKNYLQHVDEIENPPGSAAAHADDDNHDTIAIQAEPDDADDDKFVLGAAPIPRSPLSVSWSTEDESTPSFSPQSETSSPNSGTSTDSTTETSATAPSPHSVFLSFKEQIKTLKGGSGDLKPPEDSPTIPKLT